MRISDWSSDVCSSDLRTLHLAGEHLRAGGDGRVGRGVGDAIQRDALLAVGRDVVARGVVRAIGTKCAPLARAQVVEAVVEEVGQRPSAELRLGRIRLLPRSEEHTSELQSLMRISYAVFCLKKKKYNTIDTESQE